MSDEQRGTLDIKYRMTATRDGPCVWCGGPTPMRADVPYRPDLGQVPLHIICGSDMREAYRAWDHGEVVSAELQAGMQRLSRSLKALTPGGSER